MTYTPTPEAIEAARVRVVEFARQARKLSTVAHDGMFYRVWTDPNAEQATLTLDDLETLSAAAPFIAAQAKAEALREAADEFGSWGPTGIAAANALRNRAATIESESTNV